MECPYCGASLVEKKYHGVVVDVCAMCKGIWFDYGELKQVVDGVVATKKDLPNSGGMLKEKVINVDTLSEASKQCPRCNEKMEKFNYSYDSNVILDRCSNCEGIWADGGELKKVAIYNKGNPALAGAGKELLEGQKDIQKAKKFLDDFNNPNKRRRMRSGSLIGDLVGAVIDIIADHDYD
ncbi:MAG: zf-TFIIB domain-containing protein [bacterium]|nr:zf-TFIIB domain-containing protein [bacterium]